MKNKFFSIAGMLILMMVFSGAVTVTVQAEEELLTIGTGNMAGVYYPVGTAIANLINKNTDNHGLHCTAQATGASVFNVVALRSGELNMGIVQSDIQHYAYTGTGPEQFVNAGPDKELRVLLTLYNEAFTLVVRTDAGINSYDDLAGKRVNIGDTGSGNRSTMELLMKEYGWTPNTFKPATYFRAAEMADKLCNNDIDAFVYVVGHPNASIKKVAATCEIRVIPVSGPTVDAFIKKYPFYTTAIVPAGMYRNNPVPVQTFGPAATLMCNSSMSDETAYQIVKTIFKNMDQLRNLHEVFSYMELEDMVCGNTAPFHPGAIRYFKEIGLMP